MAILDLSSLDQLSFRTSEAYKTLRTNIEFCGKDQKVIALTSCISNEGKSTVCLNLARALADTGRKTILIDADMRKSVLLGLIGSAPEKIRGLSSFLSGQVSLREVIQNTTVENFDIILAGRIPPNPAELLGSSYFKEMLKYLRQVYDYIIIDTPPLGSVIDGAVVAKRCDGVAIVVATHTVSHHFVRKVRDQLASSGCKVLGVILNKLDPSDGGYFKGHYGKYYSKYYDSYSEYYTGENQE